MGVVKKTIKQGDGATYPKKGDTLVIHYTGTFSKGGKKFDSSKDRHKPFVFKVGVGQVIKGWDEGVMTMSLGERAKLHITSDYAYGSKGVDKVIPPDADLDFDVQLFGVGDNKIAIPEKNCIVM